MKIYYIKDTYGYFSQLNPNVADGKILDYGSNYGTFLDSADNNINHNNYVGVDVDQDSLSEGRKLFPEAVFLASNYYNCMYNHSGTNTRPPIEQYGPYNTIISYSVLTHTDIDDFVDTIDWLYNNLTQNGKLMITWLDVDDPVTKNYFYFKRLKEFGSCDSIKTDTYLYLANNKAVTEIPTSVKYFLLFFNKNYLLKMLSKRYKSVTLHNSPKTKNCFQSCLVIERV